MVIGVDAGALGIKDNRLKVGTYQVTKNLLIELTKIDKKNEYLLYSFYDFKNDFLEKIGRNFKPVTFKPAKGFFKLRLPLQFLFKKIDVFLALNQALPWFHPFKTIVFVHDIAFEYYPSCYPDSYRRLVLQTKHAVFNSDKIIVPSNTVAKDLIGKYRVKETKIKVIYEGVPLEDIQKSADFKKYQPYFLYVGSFKRIKNLPKTIAAFFEFKKKDKNNFKLILAGSNFWFDREIEKVIKGNKFKNDVINLGYVSDKKLPALYSSAFAFLSPSLYEGFGLTYLEALKFGCPVIAGNKGAVKEIIGNTGIFVNPESVDSIKKGIDKIVRDLKLRQKLIIFGKKRVSQFSWKKFAEEFYQEVLKLNPIVMREGSDP